MSTNMPSIDLEICNISRILRNLNQCWMDGEANYSAACKVLTLTGPRVKFC